MKVENLVGDQMNYRRILSLLFFVEMIIGASLVGVGVSQSSTLLIVLGASVFLAHLVEYFLLFKTR